MCLLGGLLQLPVEKQRQEIMGQETAIRTVQVKTQMRLRMVTTSRGWGEGQETTAQPSHIVGVSEVLN